MKTLIFVAMLLAGVFGGGYVYYKSSVKKTEELTHRIESLVASNTQLKSNEETLRQGIEESNKTIDYLQDTYDRLEQAYDDAQSDFNIIRMENAELKNKLARHDLQYLASRKPGLIEKRVNDASKDVNRCFEIMTGSPWTDKEKKATSGNEFNSECPWLWEEKQ
jgi:predicted nuclease with TOPRIM domain